MRIELEEITHVYMPGTPFARQALRGVSLTLEEGSFTVVAGPSGSGKTTLMQHLNGLLRPTSGRLLIDGQPAGSSREALITLRRRIGLVFQMPEQQFFAESVFEEVAFAPRNLGLTFAQLDQRVRESLELVGLDSAELCGRSPFHLSSGQQRLVAIASVLAMQPEALVLDEPAAGLDAAGRERLFELFRRLNLDGGLTICVVSHRLEEVAALAGKIIVLDEGRLAMEGPPQAIFACTDELRRLGLALPPLTEIMRQLAACGLAVRTDIFTLEEARREIAALRGGASAI